MTTATVYPTTFLGALEAREYDRVCLPRPSMGAELANDGEDVGETENRSEVDVRENNIRASMNPDMRRFIPIRRPKKCVERGTGLFFTEDRTFFFYEGTVSVIEAGREKHDFLDHFSMYVLLPYICWDKIVPFGDLGEIIARASKHAFLGNDFDVLWNELMRRDYDFQTYLNHDDFLQIKEIMDLVLFIASKRAAYVEPWLTSKHMLRWHDGANRFSLKDAPTFLPTLEEKIIADKASALLRNNPALS